MAGEEEKGQMSKGEGTVKEEDGEEGGKGRDRVRVSLSFERAATERRFDGLWMYSTEKRMGTYGIGMDGNAVGDLVRQKVTLRLIPLVRDRNSDLRNQEDLIVSLAAKPGNIEHFISKEDLEDHKFNALSHLRELSRLRWRSGDWSVQQIHFARRNVGAIWLHEDSPGLFRIIGDLCELFTETGCPETLLPAALLALVVRLSLKANVEKVLLCGKSVTDETTGMIADSLNNMGFEVNPSSVKCPATGEPKTLLDIKPPAGARDRDCEEELTTLLLRKPVVNNTPTLSLTGDQGQDLFSIIGWQQSSNYQELHSDVVDRVEKDMNMYFFIRLKAAFATSKICDFRLQVLSADGSVVNCSYRFKEPHCYRQRIIVYAKELVRGDESVSFIPYQKGPLNVVFELREAGVPNGIYCKKIVQIREVVKGTKRMKRRNVHGVGRSVIGSGVRPEDPNQTDPTATDRSVHDMVPGEANMKVPRNQERAEPPRIESGGVLDDANQTS